MFRLAHLSDIHLGPLPELSLRQLASKRITGFVNWHLSRRKRHRTDFSDVLLAAVTGSHPSHVAITGDLINLGLETEIEAAGLWLRAIGEPTDVSVVPGNHDAYVPGALASVLSAWRPFMTGDPPQGGDPLFPYLRVRGEVALIGVSSARASAPFMATGYFRPRQAEAVEQWLSMTGRRGLFRIVMIHHPPVSGASSFHRRLVGASLFRQIVRRHGAELVLHGHTHLPTLSWIDGAARPVPIVGVAAAGQAPGGPKPAGQFNLIEIEGPGGGWRCRLTRFGLGETQDAIVALSRTMLHGQEPARDLIA